jgi:pimeloyl-ACP methyl ester carboxylesterase
VEGTLLAEGKEIMRWHVILLIGLLIGCLGSGQVRAQSTASSFIDGPCHFKIGRGFTLGVNLRCGTLVVQENHLTPNGRMIQLAVAIFRTPSVHRLPDPVVFLQGGPGGGTVTMGRDVTSTNALKIMGNHDLILIDQRGTGFSQPKLVCTTSDASGIQAPPGMVRASQRAGLQVRYYANCRARLAGRGIDLNAYTTINDAADISDLRTALALPEMDLYGVSYGTRLALAIMRYYPVGIRSVVLDSVVPPQYNLLTNAVAAEGRAFNALFAGCARQQPCRHSFPYLKRTFQRLLQRLNQHPLTVTVSVSGRKRLVRVNGNDFAEVVRSVMYDSPLIRYLPALISYVNRDRAGVLAPFVTITNRQFSGIADALYESTTCADDAPYVSVASLKAAVATLPPAIRHNTLVGHEEEMAACRAWKVTPSDSSIHQPVTSAIPTLLLGGQYDPITPPANTSLVAATLSHAYPLVFPGIGHGVRYTNGCPDRIVNAFYDDPARAPDAACLAKMKEPAFVVPR